MSPTTLALIVVLVSLAAWVAFMAYTALVPKKASHGVGLPLPPRDSDSGTAVDGEPHVAEVAVPEAKPRARRLEEDLQGVSRRQFLNRSMGVALLVSLGQFAMASIDFLYPRLRGGLGSKITVGDIEEIRNEISANREPKFIPDGRFFLSVYEGKPEDAEKIPAYKAANVASTGIVALYRKCVHLGCSVPWCPPSKWFECPCHGSKYSVNGEYRDGPAPRSLDQFRVEVVGGKLVVDTSVIIEGAPRGTTTSQPQPEGIPCVTIREG